MSAPPDEVELLRRCAEGEDVAWSEFLSRYGRFLDYMIRRALAGARGGRVPSPDEVDDLRDEIVAWLLQDDGRVLQTYRGESKITSWLGVIVGRRARRLAQRGQGLRSKMVSFDSLSAEAASHLAVADSGDDGPRERALLRLGQAVEALSERDRALIRGAFFEQRSYADLAESLGVQEASVGQLLFRAKKRLRKELGGDAFLETLSGCLLVGLIWLVKAGLLR